MALQLQAEGTGYSGENEPTDIDKFLTKHRVSKDTIQKLINNELDTIDHLKSIGEADIDDLCKECGIKTTQKIKLKTAIKKLKDTSSYNLPPILIDKEERIALTKMAEKIKAIEGSINLVAETKKNIAAQVVNHINTIKSTFKEIQQSVQQRQEQLIQKLHAIANEKTQKLDNASNMLNQQHDSSKQKLNECSKRVSKPTQLHEINTRIEEISKIAAEVEKIKIVIKEDAVISNNKIDILLNKTVINKTINKFGNVFCGVIPAIVSLTDNKDCSIGVKWKLEPKESVSKNNNAKKLKIEWSETKSNDINQFDEKWEYNKQIDLKNDDNEPINIGVDNKIANYLFQMQYFDGNNWSSKSNIGFVSVKQKLTDSWDPNCKANNLQINGNSMINTDGNQTSAYLTRVVTEGVHCWKFKIDKLTSGWHLIGVRKTKFEVIIDDHFQRGGGNKNYAFELRDGIILDPAKSSTKLKDYGKKIVNGDIIEMTLNLTNCTLSYKINETDYGKAFDVEKTSYKAAVTMVCKDMKFTLLSYQYHQ